MYSHSPPGPPRPAKGALSDFFTTIVLHIRVAVVVVVPVDNVEILVCFRENRLIMLFFYPQEYEKLAVPAVFLGELRQTKTVEILVCLWITLWIMWITPEVIHRLHLGKQVFPQSYPQAVEILVCPDVACG